MDGSPVAGIYRVVPLSLGENDGGFADQLLEFASALHAEGWLLVEFQKRFPSCLARLTLELIDGHSRTLCQPSFEEQNY